MTSVEGKLFDACQRIDKLTEELAVYTEALRQATAVLNQASDVLCAQDFVAASRQKLHGSRVQAEWRNS